MVLYQYLVVILLSINLSVVGINLNINYVQKKA